MLPVEMMVSLPMVDLLRDNLSPIEPTEPVRVTWYSWGNDLSRVSSTSNSSLKVHALELSVTGNTFKIYQDGTLKGTKSSFYLYG